MRHRRTTAAAAALILTAGLLATQASAAPPDPKPSPPPAGMTAQEVADAQRYERAKVVLDKVSPDSKGKQGVAAADPKWSGRGYNPKTGGVIVWRVGAGQDQPGDARYRALATADVPVEVRPALVSHDDYQRIRDALADDLAKVGGPAKVDIPVRGINIEHNAEVLDGATPGRVEIYVLPGKLTPELEEFILATYVDPVLDRSKAVVLEKEMDTPSSLNAAAARAGKSDDGYRLSDLL